MKQTNNNSFSNFSRQMNLNRLLLLLRRVLPIRMKNLNIAASYVWMRLWRMRHPGELQEEEGVEQDERMEEEERGRKEGGGEMEKKIQMSCREPFVTLTVTTLEQSNQSCRYFTHVPTLLLLLLLLLFFFFARYMCVNLSCSRTMTLNFPLSWPLLSVVSLY